MSEKNNRRNKEGRIVFSEKIKRQTSETFRLSALLAMSGGFQMRIHIM